MLFTIWVTTACNFNCVYCYEGHNKENNYLNKGTADCVLNFIWEQLEKRRQYHSQIRFHGGEPLLNMEIVKYLIEGLNQRNINKQHCFSYEMTTNGYLLDDKKIDFICNNIEDVSISLDGTKAYNDSVRVLTDGTGTYDCVMMNAKKLRKKKSNMKIRLTINSHSVTNMYNNVIHLVNEGFQSIIAALDIWDDKWNNKIMDKMEMQCNSIREYISICKIEGVRIALPVNGDLKNIVCLGGITGFNIDTFGNLYPCIYSVGKSDECCGDVFNGIDKEKVQEFNKINNLVMDDCLGCGSYNYCPSVRCKFINNKRMGSYTQPIPVLCNLQSRIMNYYEQNCQKLCSE